MTELSVHQLHQFLGPPNSQEMLNSARSSIEFTNSSDVAVKCVI
jgi:hypothetical protein